MTLSPPLIARTLKQAVGRRLPQRRDDSGLTTLEWLLIVAAVAGLAALAVVLVQNVVTETGEQIAGSSARLTAAKVAAAAVVQEAKTADVADTDLNTPAEWDNYFTDKCNRITITFSDANVSMTVNFAIFGANAAAQLVNYTAPLLLLADDVAATAAKPQAQCSAA